MTKQYKNYVNGEWKLSKEEIKIYAPATGEELGSVPAMSQEEVDYVYASAKAAQKAWRALSYVERAEYLHKAADILMRDAEKSVLFFLKKSLKVTNQLSVKLFVLLKSLTMLLKKAFVLKVKYLKVVVLIQQARKNRYRSSRTSRFGACYFAI